MRRGFTLIELLVVIVIIGILVAIALPNFIRIKDKAKEAEVKQNCHAIQLALERYAVDSPGESYPTVVMGGDWQDSYVVWIEWCTMQDIDPAVDIKNPERATDWSAAAHDMGDSLVMEAYMPSYPGNPFMKTKSDTILPRISHMPPPSPMIECGQVDRVVGGRESNKMYEVFGPLFMINNQSIAGDFFVHHMFNNPPYAITDIQKTPPGGWDSPSGNNVLTGNFSYWPRGEENTAWLITGSSDILGYTLAGYGSVRTPGQDVYNRNGNYKGRFRTETCEMDCSSDIMPDVPCLCTGGGMPSLNGNNGGSDTIVDGVVVTLDSGVDKKSTRVNVEVTEGEGLR